MLRKWNIIVILLSFMLLGSFILYGQFVYDILFSVEGVLDGSTNPAPMNEGDIYLHIDGAPPVVVAGGSNAELLMGFEDYTQGDKGLDGFDVISIFLGEPNSVGACYWTSEIDFTAFLPGNPQPISNGDILARLIGYYIENQTLRWPFQFADIVETADVGLDALDVEGVDEALYVAMLGWAGLDRALGSMGGMSYTPNFSEFSGLSRPFWVFWSFETANEPHTLSASHQVFNPYTGVLLPTGTIITADDLLVTVFTPAGPTIGYLLRTGRDGLPVTAPQIESLFQGTPHLGQASVGLDAVDIPDIAEGTTLADPMSMIPYTYGSDEAGETGGIKHPDISIKILFSTSTDASSQVPPSTNGDVLALLVNPGLANDVVQGVLSNTQSGVPHLVDNPDLTHLIDFNRGLDGLDLVPYGALPAVMDWYLY